MCGKSKINFILERKKKKSAEFSFVIFFLQMHATEESKNEAVKKRKLCVLQNVLQLL